MKRLVLLLVLTIVVEIQATPRRIYSHQDVLSPEVAETITGKKVRFRNSYKYETDKILICLYSTGNRRIPQDELLIWQNTPKGYELIYKRQSLQGEIYEKPVLFSANNFRFINISTEPAGSGGFVNDSMLWLAPDGTVHEVAFEQASEVYEGLATENDIVLTGGDKEFFVEDDQLKFEFWIAKSGDPHCCPSQGSVTGTYKLQGNPKYDFFSRQYTPDFKILVQQMARREEP